MVPKNISLERLQLTILRIGAFLCLAGWTWQHFYWSSPLDNLLWTESSHSLSQAAGLSWDQYAGPTGGQDGVIDKILEFIAWLFLLSSIACLLPLKMRQIQWSFLSLGGLLLILLSYSLYIDSRGQLPMFVEHGGQMLMPLVLLSALVKGVRHKLTVQIAVIACIMTFVGHGCYALNLWPTPGNFYAMTTVILGFDYGHATTFLRIAGVLDILLCIGFAFPKWRRISALYAFAWGGITALARPVAGMSAEINYWGADQYIHEAVLRAPHFLLPLYLFYVWKPNDKKQGESSAMPPDSKIAEPSSTLPKATS